MTVARKTRAQRAELAEYAFTFCRVFGHAWQEWRTDREPEFGYYESVSCTRCTTERLFTVSLLGTVIARRYVYPEGYRLSFKVSATDLRRAMRKAGWWSEDARKLATSTRSRRSA